MFDANNVIKEVILAIRKHFIKPVTICIWNFNSYHDTLIF